MKKSKVTKPTVKTIIKPAVNNAAKLSPKPAAKKPAVKPLVKPAVKPVINKAGQTVVCKNNEVVADPKATGAGSEALRQEITALRSQLARHMAPVTSGSMEEVDALRRVLNDLMEARMNEVIRELVTLRNSAANAGGEARRIAEQMDTLLADLGAMKFEAERLEHVDPLIHTVSRETADPTLPDGIILETLRPGFHTSRGFIVAKALVTVNRRA